MLTHGVRRLRATREDWPSSREKATVSTATSMHCHSGGWLGIEAIAANAKMWNSEPAGRKRHSATTSEQAPATTVVAPTRTQVVPSAESPASASTRAVMAARNITTSMSPPARTWRVSRLACGSFRP